VKFQLDDPKPEIQPQVKAPSKTLELIKRITSQAAELDNEEVRKQKKEE
jgi:hypothetical protein